MPMNFIANMFSKLRLPKSTPASHIVVRHHGSPDKIKRIDSDHITEIRRGHFSFVDHEAEKESTMPMHKVLEIWMEENLVWKKRQRRPSKSLVRTAKAEKARKSRAKRKTTKRKMKAANAKARPRKRTSKATKAGKAKRDVKRKK